MNSIKQLKLGRILSPHGVQGWVNFFPYVDATFRWEDVRHVFIERADGTIRKTQLVDFKIQKKVILSFNAMKDRTAAENYRHSEVWIDEDQLPKLTENEFYEYELIGCPVLLENGYQLGPVKAILPAGDVSVLAIESPNGEVLIPINAENIARMSRQEIIVHPLDGLLDLN